MKAQLSEGSRTPWGPAQDVIAYGPEVVLVSTAGHGGLRVTGAAAKAIPESVWATMMHGRGWAEEDCEYPIILALLIKAGHITDPGILKRTADVWEYAKLNTRYERYASIRIPDAPKPDDGFPASVAGMFFPAC